MGFRSSLSGRLAFGLFGRRLGERAELAELVVAVLNDGVRAELAQLAQVPPERSAEVRGGQVPVAVGPSGRLLDELVDDAHLVGVAGGELERLGGLLALLRVAIEDGRARLR